MDRSPNRSVFKFLRSSLNGTEDSSLPITPVVIPTLRPEKEASNTGLLAQHASNVTVVNAQ